MIKPLLVLLLSTAFVSLGAHAEDQAVKSISPDRLAINGAEATLGLSQEWVHPKPKIERVVIVLHGRLRNAQTYLRSIERAANQSKERSKTLLIAPQFLDEKDVVAHHLSDNILRWRQNSWMEGATASDPKPISSFLVLDHILKRLSDSKLFPNLKEIVIAGHSGGAQVVQRYAMIGGKEDALLTREGVKLRYVIANPSSYAYFDAERPESVTAQACPNFNDWKYGLNKMPFYSGKEKPADIEKGYVKRDVTYLLGELDTDRNHPALDKTCAAEAQGAYRLIRGQNYFSYLQKRHPEGLNQRLVVVPKVGHNGDGMFTSPEGQAVLFKPF
ncbi:alpha/beta hydrolase [Pseudomonas alliivorans]|uniref:alpha/beta hydrolase n=1 Tax=Pseudomonas TaxID=286 RepID=UPI00161FAB71|nr:MULTISPECIES: alpha/beta hydrolase [Pseudomonas]MBP0952154.1 alpha/beta hydrolase [Pseudomonas alliivorans]MCD5985133.1 alpha/beta hydrolase [Pseudomonas sp. CDFA 610]MCQ9471386.1 alpha/beta hydrolase [Pseudomonas alliivorans]MEE4308935.1 alpha/beta hydrolase [Pseudomonas alliivorans]MEE4345078.1 alpha/beta hydrolase [Pseudomonas alliivorans]